MPEYEMVMLRFNMEKEESKIYNQLNPKNRAGHVKKILKSVIIGGEEKAQKDYIQDVVSDMMSNMNFKLDMREEHSNIPEENIDENDLINFASSIMKG